MQRRFCNWIFGITISTVIIMITLNGKGNDIFGLSNAYESIRPPQTVSIFTNASESAGQKQTNQLDSSLSSLKGFSSGWAVVQGFWKSLNQSIGPVDMHPSNLVNFSGRGNYSPPKFVWLNPTAPSAIKFIDSSKYGIEYKDTITI